MDFRRKNLQKNADFGDFPSEKQSGDRQMFLVTAVDFGQRRAVFLERAAPSRGDARRRVAF
jgi:hypothetical protein